MTQSEFNQLLKDAISQGVFDSESFQSQFSGEQLEAYLTKMVSFQESDVPAYVESAKAAADRAEAARPKLTAIILSASKWSSTNMTQTVVVNGISAAEASQLITPAPDLSSQSAYYAAGVMCTGQAENALTFKADTVPTDDLTVYVVIQEVRS